MDAGGILIVDDDPHSREILRATLSPLGHDIHLAEDCLLYTSPSPRDA